jgi:hypothetical protein
MESAHTSRQAPWISPPIMNDGSPRQRVLRFLVRLMTGTITTVVLATLALFSLHEGKDYLQAQSQPAVRSEERRGDLASITGKLAATCTRAHETAQFDSPTARCAEHTAKIARQLWHAPSSLMGRTIASLTAKTARWLQQAVLGLAPAFRGNGRYAFAD